jgi:hypothetical protein
MNFPCPEKYPQKTALLLTLRKKQIITYFESGLLSIIEVQHRWHDIADIHSMTMAECHLWWNGRKKIHPMIKKGTSVDESLRQKVLTLFILCIMWSLVVQTKCQVKTVDQLNKTVGLAASTRLYGLANFSSARLARLLNQNRKKSWQIIAC